MSAQKLMLVLGATGFLGRLVVERLLKLNYPLRVVTRGGGDWQNSVVSTLRHKGVDVIIGNVTDEATIEKAVDGTSAIINMAGSFREAGGVSYEALNIDVVKWLIKYGSAAKVQRLIHVSCLGAHKDSDSRYYRAKWKGEKAVRNCDLYWTVFRPSFMFGDSFPLLDYLKPVFTFKLFLPVIGSGTNTIQPVFVQDVADCVVQSIYARETVGKTFDLAGPEEYTMLEILEMSRDALGLSGSTMNFSSDVSGKTLGMMAKALPNSILNNELVGLMGDDSFGSQEDMLANFQVQNVSLQQYFPSIIDSLDK
ncbi:complex I NDUFA9 subunit family protein [Candidatus Obscuribacterales bacterium]|nr:complex I NDUFA9 subunit family protein [Candidatus Obscuribacterales bacterium]MBX3152561.1 complex I NDUFA9 subunit family protein [Candidatus Obscuribacterales bacterium]